MTDKELLELAAKAAGMCKESFSLDDAYYPIFEDEKGFYLAWGKGWWNPLTDDGDALRLAVKLNLDINCYPKSKEIAAVQHRQNVGVYARSIERVSDDHYAATRRAIVRAATEIGKEMK